MPISDLKPDSQPGVQAGLPQRLASLEHQIDRLTNLLAEQAAAKTRRRRLVTIRMLLFTVALSAIFFTWFANHYHRSRRQSAAVDRLIEQSVFVMYSPRQSSVVSLMPGDPHEPPASLVDWFGDDFFRAATNVSTATLNTNQDVKDDVLEAIAALDRLERLRLTNMPLRSADLVQFAGLSDLQSLDVSRTGLDYGSMPWLRTTDLRWFNASHTKFSDRALFDLSHCRKLQELRLERTAVTDEGLSFLYPLKHLRYLNLRRCPVSLAAVKKLSDALPACLIDYEPLRFLPDGSVDGRAARRGRVRIGNPAVRDPRSSRQAAAPLDRPPSTPSQSYAPYRAIPQRNLVIPMY